ncbi:GTP cyclohydrolase [Geminisphaera colitermitum]|uniref:GTP cyclohydrolase n=1 Tax=Geminisphaera colitermitum TaxID=1148786 RepID=UPI000158C49D|nr:GTP cyclohydrolase [Geminisphaera colitermitum]
MPDTPATLASLIDSLQHGAGALRALADAAERPVYGTTIYLATCALDTRYGAFRAYVFQDITDKHYILALTHGDICGATTLHTRLHSSCVTSETLRGCDCDCTQQLEGAFKVIAQKGSGILFYLMQEGRGVGYFAKARDRMLVQASQDQLSTFDAYAAMGLAKDHRNYENISHICHLLGIRASFILLTNNPDKIEALRAQGLPIAGSEPLEFEPGPFNLAYLTSKAANGHQLQRPTASRVHRASPPQPVVPFRPHALGDARRFVYAASYFLPMTPVGDDILLSGEQFKELFSHHSIERWMNDPLPLVREYRRIRGNRYFVRIHAANLAAFQKREPAHPLAALLTTPYWFRVHAYYDIVTNQDWVVLTHGTPTPDDAPVVRLHSDSIFNRFPLRTTDNRAKLKQAVKHIVTYGSGVMLLLHNDGRGAGFGAHATDRMMTEAGAVSTSDDAYRLLAVGYDSRDYDAAIMLLRHHLPSERIQMVMNSPESLVKKPEYAEALNRHHIDVEKWIFLEDAPPA